MRPLTHWRIRAARLPERLTEDTLFDASFRLPGADALSAFADLLGGAPDEDCGSAPDMQEADFILPAAIPADVPAGATVLVHDGARPLVPEAVIRRVRSAARNTDCAIPAIPVTDSLRHLEDGIGPLSEPVDRAAYRAVQTPQGASLWRMLEAYSLPYSETFTDDASVLADAGFENQVLVEGSPENIKITNPFDLEVAALLLSRREKAAPEAL